MLVELFDVDPNMVYLLQLNAFRLTENYVFDRDNRRMIEYHRGLPVQRIMQDCSYERRPSLRRRFSVKSLL